MRNALDLSSWQGLVLTLLGLALVSLVVVAIRLLVMHTVQLRRERENRQINERLRALIAAYKVLGGSFTGNLTVDPAHLRDQHVKPKRQDEAADGDNAAEFPPTTVAEGLVEPRPGAERRRRIRDAVEAALSDVVLLGTEEQVRLAATAANDMVAGRPVETAELVVSLRNFIREVLDLEAIPPELSVPNQGPARPGSGAGRGARDERGRDERGRGQGGGRGGTSQGGGAGIGGLGFGAGRYHELNDADSPPHS